MHYRIIDVKDFEEQIMNYKPIHYDAINFITMITDKQAHQI